MFLTATGGAVVVAGLGLGGFSAVDLYQRVERALRHPVPLSGVLTVEESAGGGWSVDRYLVRTFPDGRVTTEVDRSANSRCACPECWVSCPSGYRRVIPGR